MKKILKMFTGKDTDLTPEVTLEPEYNYSAEGPKASNGLSWSPRLMYPTDWNREVNLLWVRPNSGQYNFGNEKIKLLDHKDIEDFVTNIHDSNPDRRMTVVILTQNAKYVMHPSAINLTITNGTVSVKSSTFCRPDDVDSETSILIQKILDRWNTNIKFSDLYDEWKARCNRLENDGESHTIAETELKYSCA
ncbi:hypothetical protein IKM56_01835 [Candidatus Saccharibacteria bacterium]|nr:hypothetical protein [Candidatus Saccharibacteria bacterium]